jgi:hypothetical protein
MKKTPVLKTSRDLTRFVLISCYRTRDGKGERIFPKILK